MDATWFAPVAVLVLGSLLIAVMASKLAAAADEVVSSLQRFRRLEQALVPVRVETRRARAAVDRIPRR